MPREVRQAPADARRYQIMVKAKNKDGVWKELRVGPILQLKSILEDQCATINKNVAEGKEKDWCDAQVIEVDKIQLS